MDVAVVAVIEAVEVPPGAVVAVVLGVLAGDGDGVGRAARPDVTLVTALAVVPAALVELVVAEAMIAALWTVNEVVAGVAAAVLDVGAALVLTPLSPRMPETIRLAFGVPRPVTRS